MTLFKIQMIGGIGSRYQVDTSQLYKYNILIKFKIFNYLLTLNFLNFEMTLFTKSVSMPW